VVGNPAERVDGVRAVAEDGEDGGVGVADADEGSADDADGASRAPSRCA
jgi:hypothetical protein